MTTAAPRPGDLRERLAAKILLELDAHAAEGRKLAECPAGVDGRPPLTAVQRWRFTAQALLRRALGDEHTTVTAFDRHCYRGVVNVNRLRVAIELFAAGVVAARDHGLAFRFGFARAILEPALLADDSGDLALRSALWLALSQLASIAGVRGEGDHPPLVVLVDRLQTTGDLDAKLASMIAGDDKVDQRRAAETLLKQLAPAER